jgi:hypothetical protein
LGQVLGDERAHLFAERAIGGRLFEIHGGNAPTIAMEQAYRVSLRPVYPVFAG